MNILIVDDHETHLKVMCLLLGKSQGDVTIETATNGQIAVTKSRKADYDLILMDINMPIMDGVTATALIKDKKSSQVVVGITAENQNRINELFGQSLFDHIIQKPLNTEIFNTEIRPLIEEGLLVQS